MRKKEYPLQKSRQIKSNLESYTSLSLHEEITAFLSLILGIRLKVGTEYRVFLSKNMGQKNYFGEIQNNNPQKNPPPLRMCYSNPTIPYTIRFKTPEPIDLYQTKEYFSHLLTMNDEKTYIALIRSARLYSNALWICESDPENAWLLLVSAIETAAEAWKKDKNDQIKLLESEQKELYDAINAIGQSKIKEDVMQKVASALNLKAEKKFVAFITTFHKKPENKCQNDYRMINWNNYETIIKKIYELRSKVLHTGQPFPEEMCKAPQMFLYNEQPIMSERPNSGASLTHDTVINPEDKPMLLWKFEEIVRKSLLEWILSFAKKTVLPKKLGINPSLF